MATSTAVIDRSLVADLDGLEAYIKSRLVEAFDRMHEATLEEMIRGTGTPGRGILNEGIGGA